MPYTFSLSFNRAQLVVDVVVVVGFCCCLRCRKTFIDLSDGHSDIIIVNRSTDELLESHWVVWVSWITNTTSTCFRINCPLVCHIEYKVQFYLCFANIGQQQQYYGQLLQTNTTFIYTRPQSYHSFVHSSRGAIINLMRALANQQRLALRIGSTLIELWHTRHTYIHLSMAVCKACMGTGCWVPCKC